MVPYPNVRQADLVITHLNAHPTKGITVDEAFELYNIRHLPGVIRQIKKRGIPVDAVWTADPNGQRRMHMQYTLGTK